MHPTQPTQVQQVPAQPAPTQAPSGTYPQQYAPLMHPHAGYGYSGQGGQQPPSPTLHRWLFGAIAAMVLVAVGLIAYQFGGGSSDDDSAAAVEVGNRLQLVHVRQIDLTAGTQAVLPIAVSGTTEPLVVTMVNLPPGVVAESTTITEGSGLVTFTSTASTPSGSFPVQLIAQGAVDGGFSEFIVNVLEAPEGSGLSDSPDEAGDVVADDAATSSTSPSADEETSPADEAVQASTESDGAAVAAARATGEPTVVSLLASSFPRTWGAADYPEGFNLNCPAGPDTFERDGTCPALVWGDVTYWALSDNENMGVTRLIAFDPDGVEVGSWDQDGARYHWQMSVDVVADSLAVVGQSNLTVSFALNDLQQ